MLVLCVCEQKFTREAPKGDLGVLIQPLLEHCSSEKMNTWLGEMKTNYVLPFSTPAFLSIDYHCTASFLCFSQLTTNCIFLNCFPYVSRLISYLPASHCVFFSIHYEIQLAETWNWPHIGDPSKCKIHHLYFYVNIILSSNSDAFAQCKLCPYVILHSNSQRVLIKKSYSVIT